MSEFTFSFVQDDQDSFTLLVEGDAARIPFGTMTLRMTTGDAVALYEAVDGCIGDFVADKRAAFREWKAAGGADGERGFEGVGDFYSEDPMERWTAHQAAKGRL